MLTGLHHALKRFTLLYCLLPIFLCFLALTQVEVAGARSNHLAYEASRRHPGQNPAPPQQVDDKLLTQTPF